MTHLGPPSAGAPAPQAGQVAPAEARFCPACGGRLPGGHAERRVVTALFGFPTGHDDDAARAVRAALSMREIVKTAETAPGDIPLRLRMGLDTGEVSTGTADVEAELHLAEALLAGGDLKEARAAVAAGSGPAARGTPA